MVTSISIVGPAAAGGALGFHPVYLALAIGCGSKPIPWMNDAGFWIIGQMSGMTERETLKTVSVMMTIMGVVGLGATMLGAWIFPMNYAHRRGSAAGDWGECCRSIQAGQICRSDAGMPTAVNPG